MFAPEQSKGARTCWLRLQQQQKQKRAAVPYGYARTNARVPVGYCFCCLAQQYPTGTRAPRAFLLLLLLCPQNRASSSRNARAALIVPVGARFCARASAAAAALNSRRSAAEARAHKRALAGFGCSSRNAKRSSRSARAHAPAGIGSSSEAKRSRSTRARTCWHRQQQRSAAQQKHARTHLLASAAADRSPEEDEVFVTQAPR